MKNLNNNANDLTGASTVDRRSFLSTMAVTGLSVATLGITTTANAQSKTPNQPEADSGHHYKMPSPTAKTEKEFRTAVLGPATLSLLTSEVAVDKTTRADAKEFANFELREAIGVTTVLKSLGTVAPPMDALAKATLEKIRNTPKSVAFDKAYITAQLENHEFLRDLANVYLKNSANANSPAEIHTRHLAMLALATFKEHVVHTKKILAAIG